MSEKEIKDIPEDDQLNDDQLNDVAGGAGLTKPTLGISAQVPYGATAGSANYGATAGRTKIEYTGEEVDSQ